ncbi:MAG TPA: methylamine utilization protein [Burkholderiaceae bacterium]|nr:methylamine utilization protein [Burkholderiaceae bacterium]
MQSPQPFARAGQSLNGSAFAHRRTRCVLIGALIALASHAATAAPWAVRVRNAAGQPVSDAVVAVEVNGEPRIAGAQAAAQMVQRQRQFQPYVLVIQTGTAVSFPNFDTVRHHVYSFSPTKTFDIKLYAGTPARPEVFDKPGVATLGCNIHDRMSAHIVVVDTPLFAKSDADGWVRMDLPVGQHRLLYWHPRLGSTTLRSQPLRVAGDGGSSELTLDLMAD